MKTIFLPVLLATIACIVPAKAQLQKDELAATKRIVAGRTVDLSPLVDWVEAKDEKAARPLPNWSTVEGTIVGNSAYGWIVKGKVDGKLAKFVLRNPSADKLIEFQQLKQQYQVLLETDKEAQREYDEATLQNANSFEQKLRVGKAPLPKGSVGAADQVTVFDNAAIAVHRPSPAENAASLKVAAAAHALNVFDKHGYDLTGNFPVFAYAMRLPQAYGGIVIYDHGIEMK